MSHKIITYLVNDLTNGGNLSNRFNLALKKNVGTWVCLFGKVVILLRLLYSVPITVHCVCCYQQEKSSARRKKKKDKKAEINHVGRPVEC